MIGYVTVLQIKVHVQGLASRHSLNVEMDYKGLVSSADVLMPNWSQWSVLQVAAFDVAIFRGGGGGGGGGGRENKPVIIF